MDDLLEIVLIGLEFPVFLILVFWLLRFQSEAGRRERVQLKFRNLSRRRKSLGILVIASFVFAFVPGCSRPSEPDRNGNSSSGRCRLIGNAVDVRGWFGRTCVYDVHHFHIYLQRSSS